MYISRNNNISIKFPITHPFYELKLRETDEVWNFDMTVAIAYINTNACPHVSTVLEKHLPSILKCDCYNSDNLPFREELKHTELGHLFEHMLLEYLCIERIECGKNRAEFFGKTSWNWVRETRGMFHIKITKTDKESPYFLQAMKKSLGLLNLILYASSANNQGAIH